MRLSDAWVHTYGTSRRLARSAGPAKISKSGSEKVPSPHPGFAARGAWSSPPDVARPSAMPARPLNYTYTELKYVILTIRFLVPSLCYTVTSFLREWTSPLQVDTPAQPTLQPVTHIFISQ